MIHSLAYSYIGLQTAYLATYFPSVYWNTACLRVDAGLEEEASTNYNKIAKAVGNIINRGITVLPVDINKSGYMFEPDEKTNSIYYGMKSLNGVGGEIIADIINNRPYASLQDLIDKVSSANKTVIIALIKSGAFDQFGERKDVMAEYLRQVSSPKKRITLQNFSGLMEKNLIPKELKFQRTLFRFNKSLKARKKIGDYFAINFQYYDFYSKHFDVDLLEPMEDTLVIPQKTWQKLYTKAMEPAKIYFKENQQALLDAYNDTLFQEQWKKYAGGNYSSWEMDSLGYYYHDHELAGVDLTQYGIVPYSTLPSEPEVVKTFTRNGKTYPLRNIVRIAGTVIGKNNTKATVDILTVESGVVTVKFNLEFFAYYNRRISDNINGENKVVENGWFNKGTMIVVAGYRNGDTFRGKTYSRTPFSQLYKITEVNGRFMEMTDSRYGEEEW